MQRPVSKASGTEPRARVTQAAWLNGQGCSQHRGSVQGGLRHEIPASVMEWGRDHVEDASGREVGH